MQLPTKIHNHLTTTPLRIFDDYLKIGTNEANASPPNRYQRSELLAPRRHQTQELEAKKRKDYFKNSKTSASVHNNITELLEDVSFSQLN